MAAVSYIHGNPVRAGLVRVPEAWLFSSASRASTRTKAGETPALPER